MELANGVDIIEIGRIARSMEAESFLGRFFSQEEQAYFLVRHNAPQSVAANFAAKEAFAKALGLGFRGFELREVAVLRDDLGRPFFRLTGNAAQLAAGWHFAVSLSHDKTHAIAMVTAWR